ncbi:protein-S-isoprenylcysteine O-methyltransferase [Mesorhizobium sp. YM1C-6-2]|jgi:protein-S-isoprenylcysteine O-methyltransferase Ste14|uniref:protein-S-isoprenylcysteine O-methyltransferase n=1 Tax=Mesorhizobium sp. YM1C-6-2 TaxID=1827501 RepID=UPI000EF265D2|nr:protein-S-isoprenylcysteine O-methyltransferase [Mesorhizobium sp. YM1C-6-2]RLP25353.1 isoprenylcysteine carboxylmethyltransferase family protein [Mesorhizobium sp. YM1C-6-2]
MASVGEVSWLLGIVAWYIIRYPFERRAKRVRVVRDYRSLSEKIALSVAFFGMAILPAFYVATGIPSGADYTPRLWAIAAGIAVFVFGLWVFRRAHKDLGRNWSVTLEIRDQHKFVSRGLYRFVRHPMYASFLLVGLAQALLLPNWVAGMSGLIGFAVLFLMRVNVEERMMLDNFGDEYRAYCGTTKRIIPYIY